MVIGCCNRDRLSVFLGWMKPSCFFFIASIHLYNVWLTALSPSALRVGIRLQRYLFPLALRKVCAIVVSAGNLHAVQVVFPLKTLQVGMKHLCRQHNSHHSQAEDENGREMNKLKTT